MFNTNVPRRKEDIGGPTSFRETAFQPHFVLVRRGKGFFLPMGKRRVFRGTLQEYERGGGLEISHDEKWSLSYHFPEGALLGGCLLFGGFWGL